MDNLSQSLSACSLLSSRGWNECSRPFGDEITRCFYKRFETPTRCQCNNEKSGIQVCVSVFCHEEFWRYEIELSGELPDGTWIRLHNWGMPANLEDGLATIPRLLKTWEFISSQHLPEKAESY